MKNLNSLAFVIIIFFLGSISSQNNCKVLKKDIIGEYKGGCKKGLANGHGVAKGENMYEGKFKSGLPHGVGTMVYSDGKIYIGSWKKGMKNGEGKLTFIYDGHDSIQNGVWKNDKYKGIKKKKSYKIITSQSVPRYNIRKISDNTNRVTIRVKNNGSSFKTPENISGSSGNILSYQYDKAFENIVDYPFRCEMRYTMPNKFNSIRFDVIFIFEILQPGDWLVEIYH